MITDILNIAKEKEKRMITDMQTASGSLCGLIVGYLIWTGVPRILSANSTRSGNEPLRIFPYIADIS